LKLKGKGGHNKTKQEFTTVVGSAGRAKPRGKKGGLKHRKRGWEKNWEENTFGVQNPREGAQRKTGQKKKNKASRGNI